MSKVSRLVGLAGALAVVSIMGACSSGPNAAFTTPGWYLELPYPVAGAGPSVQGGPFSYDQCEAKRKQSTAADRMICVNETKQPVKFGFY